ncbi:MAG TPA: hypothetical protein VK518_04595, partial [Puia sp.]|nr:hypothetical protein [Puia sp.]
MTASDYPNQSVLGLALFLFTMFFGPGCQQKNGDWFMYKADALSSSYSDLRQVNKENVRTLKLAWAFDPDDALPDSRPA